MTNFLKDFDRSKKLTLVTGVFDLLHQEHLNFLKAAKQLAGYLIIGIESDLRVKALKGEHRPINSQDIRKKNLESLGIADLVFVLPEKFSQRAEHQALIDVIQPDFLAVSEHSPFQDVKKEIIESVGGKLVVVHPHNPGISSTRNINSRQNSQK